MTSMGRDVPSASNPSIGRRSASGAKAQQGLKSGLRCPLAIVPKHELIKVDLKLRLADPSQNHTVSEIFVLWSTVPAVSDTWYRQSTHRQHRCFRIREARGWPQRGQRNPSGYRLAARYCWQASSVANWRQNSRRFAGKETRHARTLHLVAC